MRGRNPSKTKTKNQKENYKMKNLTAKNETQAKAEIQKISQANPGKYFVAIACFGLYARAAKSLSVFAPSDSVFGWYALNGKIKNFTTRQIVADQRATPTMA